MKNLGKAGTTFGTVVTATLIIMVIGASSAVAASLITSARIKNNTIQSVDVRNNNLAGVDVQDGSLGGADIANGSLTGADVADGTVGKSDINAAARGFVSLVTNRVTDSIGASTTNTRTVFCPEGSVAIGGGGYVVPTGFVLLGSTSGETVRSHPVVTGGFASGGMAAGDDVAPAGWRTVVRNLAADPSTAVHYAICATK